MTAEEIHPRRSTANEHAPLLKHISFEPGDLNDSTSDLGETLPDPTSGTASFAATAVNLAKTCMGTGCLTLPYAAKQGGALIFFFGMIAIAFWNVFAAVRLSDCWDLLTAPPNRNPVDVERSEDVKRRNPAIIISTDPPPPEGTSTYSKVAWYALGPPGLVLLDSMTVILLTGVVVAYNDAVRLYLQDIGLATGSDVIDSSVIALVIGSLSIVPDMGYLAKTSATGLVVMFLGFAVVALYGMSGGDEDTLDDITLEESSDSTASSIQWYPRDGLTGVSQWFGCVAYGFGIVPMTFNFRESMAEPSLFGNATLVALMMVTASYLVMGWGFFMLFPEIDGDILSELPSHGFVPSFTRLAMSVVFLATAPLILVPCAEILEGKFKSPSGTLQDDKAQKERIRMSVRYGLSFLTAAIGVFIPRFVSVLTLVGCFCVGLVGFGIPPGLHLMIVYRQHCHHNEHDDSPHPARSNWENVVRTLISSWRILWVDAVFFLWGMAATAISTAYVFRHEMEG